MSHTPFLESQSADPVEQAIAHKVMAILNDGSLDRVQRETPRVRHQIAVFRGFFGVVP